MDDNHGSLAVSIKELGTIHVAYIDNIPKPEPGNMHLEISECFQRLQGWVDNLGLDHQSLLHVGVPILRNAQLLKYECCVEVPDPIQTGADAIGIKDLPGGLFAILAIEKEPEIIGKSLELFYKEYIPQKMLHLDEVRPTYEIYYEKTMEYCVPILNPHK
jgi:DNA gyrase inhibitor GyrI